MLHAAFPPAHVWPAMSHPASNLFLSSGAHGLPDPRGVLKNGAYPGGTNEYNIATEPGGTMPLEQPPAEVTSGGGGEVPAYLSGFNSSGYQHHVTSYIAAAM